MLTRRDNSRMAKKGRRSTSGERLTAIQMYENRIPADRIADILGVSSEAYSKSSLKKYKPMAALNDVR